MNTVMHDIAQKLHQQLQPLTALERLKWLANTYKEGMVFSTSLGEEDQVITQLIATHQLPISIFTLDTGRLFQETYELYDKTIARYKIPIAVYFPDTNQVQEMVSKKGMNSFYESVAHRKECCAIRKIEPLQRALKGSTIWITGLRAAQSENRKELPFAEWDENNKVIKVHPLLDWSRNQLEEHLQQENIPINALHEKGFPSIGCAPCTRAILAGEDSRAGRWWWENSQKECGLHSENSIEKINKQPNDVKQ